jgi:dihydrofolate reductase
MSKVTCDMGMSIDGYVAGPNQSRENPLGEGAETVLHSWMFDEPEAHRAELDAIVDAGAFIMGRNMFGPIRGEWDEAWRGWWGEDPPYHAPVFVLTHHPHEPIPMEGGTTFHFVADGIESALAQAREVAGDRNVSVAGGASTVNQYLAIGAIDELRLHIAPIVFGRGERLFEGLGPIALEAVAVTGNERVTHVTYRPVR